MTILIIFPEQFGENYRIDFVGVVISYLLNIKVLRNFENKLEKWIQYFIELILIMIIRLMLERFSNNIEIFTSIWYTNACYNEIIIKKVKVWR